MAGHRFVTSPNVNDVTKVDKETSPATLRTRRERLSCDFCPLEGKIVNKSWFPSFKTR